MFAQYSKISLKLFRHSWVTAWKMEIFEKPLLHYSIDSLIQYFVENFLIVLRFLCLIEETFP